MSKPTLTPYVASAAQIATMNDALFSKRVVATLSEMTEVCTFCGDSPEGYQWLVAGQQGVRICQACVSLALCVLNAERDGSDMRIAQNASERCGFCKQHATTERPLVSCDRASICQLCLALCAGPVSEVLPALSDAGRWLPLH